MLLLVEVISTPPARQNRDFIPGKNTNFCAVHYNAGMSVFSDSFSLILCWQFESPPIMLLHLPCTIPKLEASPLKLQRWE